MAKWLYTRRADTVLQLRRDCDSTSARLGATHDATSVRPTAVARRSHRSRVAVVTAALDRARWTREERPVATNDGEPVGRPSGGIKPPPSSRRDSAADLYAVCMLRAAEKD